MSLLLLFFRDARHSQTAGAGRLALRRTNIRQLNTRLYAALPCLRGTSAGAADGTRPAIAATGSHLPCGTCPATCVVLSSPPAKRQLPRALPSCVEFAACGRPREIGRARGGGKLRRHAGRGRNRRKEYGNIIFFSVRARTCPHGRTRAPGPAYCGRMQPNRPKQDTLPPMHTDGDGRRTCRSQLQNQDGQTGRPCSRIAGPAASRREAAPARDESAVASAQELPPPVDSNRLMSASVISFTSSSSAVCRGSHLSTALALAGLPSSWSTSAGRK